MIRPNDAELIPFAELPKFLPPGRRGRAVSPKTLHRWATHGLRGVKLQYVQAGGRRCATMSQINAFFDRLTEIARSSAHHAATAPTPDESEANNFEADAMAVAQRLATKYFKDRGAAAHVRSVQQAL